MPLRRYHGAIRTMRSNGTGYLVVDGPGPGSVFFHINDFEHRVHEHLLKPGVRLSFSLEDGPKGTRAIKVKCDG